MHDWLNMIMFSLNSAQPGPSRVAPPTPTNEETTLLIPTDHSRNLQTSQPRPQLVQVL